MVAIFEVLCCDLMDPVLLIHKLIDMMLGYTRLCYKITWERVGEPNLLDLTRSVDGEHIELVHLVAILCRNSISSQNTSSKLTLFVFNDMVTDAK